MSKFFSEKNAEFIDGNALNFQVLRNLILRKRAKFAFLINSTLIYPALIYSRIKIYSLKVSQIYKPYGFFYACPFQWRLNLFIAVWCSKGWHKRSDSNYGQVKNEKHCVYKSWPY